MIRFLLPWILASALVGHFGRHRRFGFWGFFFFSLILSPFVGALSLLAGAPAGGARAARAREIAASKAPHRELAGSSEALHASRPVRAGIRSLVFAWVVVVVVFGIVFLLGGAVAPGGIAETSGSDAFLQALELSFEVGTLGRATSLPDIMSVAASIERLLVLAILVLMVSRIVAARHVAPLREARESAGRSLQRVEELEQSMRAQQAEMAAMQRRAGPSGPAEIEAMRATEPAVPA